MSSETLPKLPLMEFVDADDCGSRRFYLAKPWRVGDYVYATDARIAVRVDPACWDGDLAGEGDGCQPKMEPIFAGIAGVKEWAPLPKFPACEDCRGTGKAGRECESCAGTGSRWCKQCTDEHECQCCEGVGVLYDTCDFCPVPFGPKWVHRQLANKLKSLPNVEWGSADDEPLTPVFFRFTGGAGAVSPIRKDA